MRHCNGRSRASAARIRTPSPRRGRVARSALNAAWPLKRVLRTGVSCAGTRAGWSDPVWPGAVKVADKSERAKRRVATDEQIRAKLVEMATKAFAKVGHRLRPAAAASCKHGTGAMQRASALVGR